MGNAEGRPHSLDLEPKDSDSGNATNTAINQHSNIIRVVLKREAEHPTLGLVLEERDDVPKVYVAGIIDDTPAARGALVRKNDFVIRVNEQEVCRENAFAVQMLLQSFDVGTPVVLLLQCREDHAVFLKTVFLADGSPNISRVDIPLQRAQRQPKDAHPVDPNGDTDKESRRSSSPNENSNNATVALNATSPTTAKTPTSIETISEFLRSKVGLGISSGRTSGQRATAGGEGPNNVVISTNNGQQPEPQKEPQTVVCENGTTTQQSQNQTQQQNHQSPQIILTNCDKSEGGGNNNTTTTVQQTDHHLPLNNNASPSGKDVVAMNKTTSSQCPFTGVAVASVENSLSTERRPSSTGSLGTPSRSPSSSRRGSVCSPKRHQKLRFLIEDTMTADTLHNQAIEGAASGCDGNVCKGSLLAAPRSRAPGEPRPLNELRAQAKDFIDQYYTSIKRYNTVAHHERLEAIEEELEKNGTYMQTTSELTFGAKTAWRNASRCIGRIQWSKLQVFDARHITTAHGMFEALCNHIKYATNKGNIRSAITVFPPRTDGAHDFRVWNSQLISYAGYRQQPEGNVIGDPANIKITEICERLGWKAKNGMFDVLPLVVQANGNDPEIFEFPEDLVLQVKITHPKYDWFADLGFHWYAVPAVANMMLDCGGLEYTGIPFNGWYMGTEIGARDLCDAGRYNLTETIAKRMGLDTTRTSSLWRDQAIVEVNVAVLHSYQSQRVTITDHHAASESFMKHMENELRLRGGTPADWVWIVPPISGSACPVFHQEMLNYKLKPSYEYMDEAWKTHVWEKDRENGEVARPRKKRSFRDIARAVNFSARLMGKALSRRIKCTILYATETGKSETYAKRLCHIFGHAFDPKVMSMDDYDVIHLEHEALVLFVVSTFGNGDPPETGEEFAKELYAMMKPAHSTGSRERRENPQSGSPAGSYLRMESLGSPKPGAGQSSGDNQNPDDNLLLHTGPLSNVRYSVFGLGSTAYPKFAAYGKFVDRLMADLAGERITELGTGDELCGQEQSFQTWAKDVFKAACETFCVGDINMGAATSSLLATDSSWAPGRFRLSPVAGGTAPDACKALSTLHNKKVRPCRTIAKKYLQDKQSDRQTILIRLDTQNHNSELMYSPGDHIGIYPANRKTIVDAICERLEPTVDVNELCNFEKLNEKNTVLGTFKQWGESNRLPNPVSVRIALTRYLDITTPPTPIFLKQLASIATDPNEQKKLQNLASKVYEEWKYRLTPTLAEVLAEFPSVCPDPTLLLSQLPLLQPRFYSISCSPLMFPGEIHATVAIVTYRTQDGAGPVHYGVCSNWLNKLKEGDIVPCFVRTATNFQLPEDRSSPVIMVGPGTGIAPFRSFWQQRRLEMDMDTSAPGRSKWGPMSLYYGCRYAHVDNVYREETGQAVADGVLSAVHTAFSRMPGQPKTYVQHLMVENGQEVADAILNQDGHFYVCGDVMMAAQVTETLETILSEHGHLTPEQAKDHVIRMRERTRFHEDIFGTLRISEVRDVIKVQTSKLPDLSTRRRRSFQNGHI